METGAGHAASLIEKLGSRKVSTDSSSLTSYAASINGTLILPSAIVFPETETDIFLCIEFARHHGLKLYPASRGRNLGYGDIQGTAGGQIILDLRNMNRILEVNEELCYVRFEPGVSQVELYNYLKSNNSRLGLDVTGAGLDASIAGNVLERGFGHTPYGDRFARVMSLTVITGSGEKITTGMGAFGNPASPTYRYGTGPMLEGLFSQSNFGIITEMTLELMPEPESMTMFVISCQNPDSLGNIVDNLRELKLAGVITSAVHIANKSRAIGQGENKLAGYWNLSGVLTGPSSVVRAQEKAIKSRFSDSPYRYRVVFIGKKLHRLLSFVHNRILKLSFFPVLDDVYGLQAGIPTDGPLKTLMDDEKLDSATFKADQYNTCFSWINAIVPATHIDANKAAGILKALFDKSGFEFRITMTAVTSRTLILISNVNYDRNPEGISKGLAFVAECSKALNAAGYYPYRAGSGMYDKLPGFTQDYSSVLSKLKNTFDPDNILAPGKYNIGA